MTEDNLFEKYKILIQARNFHYENFIKWLTYFYVANSAVFIGFIQISLSDSGLDRFVLPVLSFGLVAGILLYWSSKGYYYWNINFITLISNYEKNVLKWDTKSGIYSVFANKEKENNYLSPFHGANFSTSKIAIFFSFIIAVVWCSLLINDILFKKLELLNNYGMTFRFLMSVILSFIVISLLTYINSSSRINYLNSKIESLDDLNINESNNTLEN